MDGNIKSNMPNSRTVFHPDSKTQFLMRALAVVEEITLSGEAKDKGKRLSLFLEGHYPFFDHRVQSILLERRLGIRSAFRAYPVDAYLWAEQYGWIAYDNSPFKTSLNVDEFASFYLAHDLRWFSRLLTAITDVIEDILDPTPSTHELRLQIWRNAWSERSPSQPGPSTWLEGTKFVEGVPERNRSGQMNSIRASAGRINSERRAVFGQWLPYWKAELEHLREQLQWLLAEYQRDNDNS